MARKYQEFLDQDKGKAVDAVKRAFFGPKRFPVEKRHGPKKARLVRFSSLIWAYAWIALIGAYYANIGFDLPALRYQYSYQGSSTSPHYKNCDYLLLDGKTFRIFGPSCPMFVMSGFRD